MEVNYVITKIRVKWYLRALAQETRAATNMLQMLNMSDKRISKLSLALKHEREDIIEMLSNRSDFDDFKELIRALSADVSEILQLSSEGESNDGNNQRYEHESE